MYSLCWLKRLFGQQPPKNIWHCRRNNRFLWFRSNLYQNNSKIDTLILYACYKIGHEIIWSHLLQKYMKSQAQWSLNIRRHRAYVHNTQDTSASNCTVVSVHCTLWTFHQKLDFIQHASHGARRSGFKVTGEVHTFWNLSSPRSDPRPHYISSDLKVTIKGHVVYRYRKVLEQQSSQ